MHIFHKWKAVAVKERREPVLNYGVVLNENLSVPKTDILYRCTCGAVKSADIHGYWTLAQISGLAAEEKGAGS